MKPNYRRVDSEEIARIAHVVKYGDELLSKAGFKVTTRITFGSGQPPKKVVPTWMDPITMLWLRRGSEIPWTQFQAAIQSGMRGDFAEVEMFLFSWEE